MAYVKKLFAGGNTTEGFFSFYHEIIDEQAKSVFILKGGPGSGKSTLMKKLVDLFSKKGFDIEQFHCSSDVNSLDGVMIPALKVAVIDGTAPHVVDPKYPGSVEQIINLGSYWNSKNLEYNKNKIIKISKEKLLCFKRAYRFLRAAKEVYEDIEHINSLSVNDGKNNVLAQQLIQEIFKDTKVSLQKGKNRHLFASAITPQGPVNELKNLVNPMSQQYIVKGEPGTGKSIILQKIVTSSIERNIYVEVYHCPFKPSRIEHVLLPSLNTAIVTSHPPHLYDNEKAIILNLNNNLSLTKRDYYQDSLYKSHILLEELTDRVFSYLREAKEWHDQLEEYYVKQMDFKQLDEVFEQLVKTIMSSE